MKKNKKFKKILFAIMFVIMPAIVFAAAASYTSSLYISPGSLHTGAERDFSNANHKIGIKADSYGDASLTHKLIVRIGTKGILGDFNSKAQKTTPELTIGSTVTTTMGNVGSGKRVYQFQARNSSGTYYSGVNSSYVKMTSY